MQPVKLLPRNQYGRVQNALLVDETHVVVSDRFWVDLVEVERVGPDEYRAAYDYAYITIAKGGRTVSALEKIVRKLRGMSGYELITKHYDARQQIFLVNKEVENCGRYKPTGEE
ncbi:hypothetical protein [Paenibacillus flagellatus]|uniref:Uncharacterized protein n=1 Tax=Paenibacillus flagellatus TaxID=2211139 RepID=A0A2V5KSC0_9BACL|nr:hypothetical protein [Paenibacillus flagellatus]PYI54497.1 hypothetical protein DLM86_13610 [Paenibacillus flagellatus]